MSLFGFGRIKKIYFVPKMIIEINKKENKEIEE